MHCKTGNKIGRRKAQYVNTAMLTQYVPYSYQNRLINQYKMQMKIELLLKMI